MRLTTMFITPPSAFPSWGASERRARSSPRPIIAAIRSSPAPRTMIHREVNAPTIIRTPPTAAKVIVFLGFGISSESEAESVANDANTANA